MRPRRIGIFAQYRTAQGFEIPDDLDYVHICENNTIYGTKFWELPHTNGHTLVADVSSCILSEPVDVSRYGVLYGGAQKNIGPAGVVIVIIRGPDHGGRIPRHADDADL